MTQGTDTEVIAFVDAGIASGNIDMMRGIAETVTDLSDEQTKGLLFSGSLEVATSMIGKLAVGSTVFAEIAQTALSEAEIAGGASIKYFDENNSILDAFLVVKPSCDSNVESTQDEALRFAKDNIAHIILGLNLDNLDTTATTVASLILEIEKSILSNQNAPTDVVTPYLTNSSDVLKAKAFVHANTDNAEIVNVMIADDTAGNNIDGFKLSMIEDLNTDAMIQSNASIVTYLLGETQSTPVRYAMFKNYITVVLNGGNTIAGIDTEALIAAYVG